MKTFDLSPAVRAYLDLLVPTDKEAMLELFADDTGAIDCSKVTAQAHADALRAWRSVTGLRYGMTLREGRLIAVRMVKPKLSADTAPIEAPKSCDP